jgi:hypothetical protein
MVSGAMKIDFAQPDLDRLEWDASFTMGESQLLVRMYRKVLNALWCSHSVRDIRALEACWNAPHNLRPAGRTPGSPDGRLGDCNFIRLTEDRILEYELIASGDSLRVNILRLVPTTGGSC